MIRADGFAGGSLKISLKAFNNYYLKILFLFF